ncbi:MAG: hypothetical protein DRG83_17650 [Deltaproteobacteria bacterium]|nr:MAG: hypothetical protein DRG83_17650 [Deltaproteobacteria bacterium]
MKVSTVTRTVNNERGAILIIALLMLIILSLLGMAATDTTNIEIQIAGNEKVYKQAFYNADSGVFYAVAKGEELLLSATPGTQLNSTDMPNNVTLTYVREITSGPPRQVEIRAVGTAPGGGNVSILAGIEFVIFGKQQGPGNLTNY